MVNYRLTLVSLLYTFTDNGVLVMDFPGDIFVPSQVIMIEQFFQFTGQGSDLFILCALYFLNF